MASPALEAAPAGPDPAAPSGGKARASLADWLAVAAGTLGAMMATLDISIVNSALPTIQGEIGATGSEGAWVATAYLVAEIVIIPLSAWLTRLFGLRSFLIGTTIIFTAFSVVCGLSTSLMMMVIGRTGQGITGGALIPTAQTIIAQRLPREQQPTGTALFGVVVILGPLMGPLLGGWLTEALSWHYAFFLNVPVSIVLLVLLFVGLPPEPSRLDLIGEADWLGIAGLALGLGGLTVFLEEGSREQWFDSELIRWMFAIMVLGFALLFWGQAKARRPVIKLSLLLERQFGAVAVMGVAIGVVLYGTSYAIPQFLAAIADYNALQAGKVVMVSGIPSILMMPFVPLLIKHVDIRAAVAFGMSMMFLSAYIDAELTIQSAGEAFTVSQLLRGVGTILGMMFLSQACVQAVPPEDAGDAAGLFNGMRNLGGSFALAGISILQDSRMWLHERRLEAQIDANALSVQDYVAALSQRLGSTGAALQVIGQQIRGQALVMVYNDIFLVMSGVVLCVMPGIAFLRPLARGGHMRGAVH